AAVEGGDAARVQAESGREHVAQDHLVHLRRLEAGAPHRLAHDETPSLVAGVCARPPPRVPMAVRVALTITGVGMTGPPSRRRNVAPPAPSRHPLDSGWCAAETGARMARFALIMSGGGARGAYEAGVLSYVLDDLPRRLGRPVRFQIITGTSVGAIHACYVAGTI